jgi:hypothetical protein
MKIKLTSFAWPLLIFAVLAWAAVGIFAWTILSDEADRVVRVQNAQEAEQKEASAKRLHAIAQDTEFTRGQLDDILDVDVISVVDMIEAAGKAAGVKLVVSSVQPENAPPLQGRGTSQVIATGFVVEAQGRFASLMHAVQLFETLPVPAKVGRLDIERIQVGDTGTSDMWRLNAQIHMLTTSDIPS